MGFFYLREIDVSLSNLYSMLSISAVRKQYVDAEKRNNASDGELDGRSSRTARSAERRADRLLFVRADGAAEHRATRWADY